MFSRYASKAEERYSMGIIVLSVIFVVLLKKPIIFYAMAGLLFIISLIFKPINAKTVTLNTLGLLLICAFNYLLFYIFYS
ncbi:hypothetical protein ACEOWG_002937 [Bacillus cereus]